MYRLKWTILCLLILSLLGCEDERVYRKGLMEDCQNHYRAQSYKVALKACTIAADESIPDAYWLLGNLYDFRLIEAEQSEKQAFSWYLKAAKAGHIRAQVLVGDALLYGIGVAKDYEQAFIWFQKAAEQNSPDAAAGLGDIFLNGKGRAIDEGVAVYWFRKAASEGHMQSINNLAWIFATSKNASIRSGKKAQFWAEKLEINNANAAAFLDTQAAVQAELGDFGQAIRLQNMAIERLAEDTDEATLVSFQDRLEAYQNAQAWRE